MALFNHDTIKLFNSKKVCWYPSSGADINSINFWRNGLGNKIIPEVFIFTDNAFIMTENSLSIAENDNMIDKLKGYGFIKTHYEEIEDAKNFKNVLIKEERLINKLDLSVMQNYIKEEQADKWNSILDLKELGIIDNFDIIANQDFMDIFNNHFIEILNKNFNIIQNDPELTGIYPQRILNFKNEKLNTELVFIKTRNDIFYNICIEKNIRIPCFQLKRPNDERLFNGFNLSTLSIKEAIIREQDLEVLHGSDNFRIINRFQWSTHYYDDFAEMIRLD
jgi:hypothetical protein